MAYVETWVHVIGLLSCIIIFAVSLQQVCITAIRYEKPKSIYRIMTATMAFIEVLLHFAASLWYESQSPSSTLTIIIHILRLLSAVSISATFYPILITTIQHFYDSREFKDQLKIPQWLLAPWKYIIASVIIVCIICYIIVFIQNSLSALFFYYIIADMSQLCACITVGAAMIDVYFKVQETAKSLESQLHKKQLDISTLDTRNNNNNNNDNGIIIQQDSIITTQSTFELQQATKEINKGKYFMIALIFIIILAASRSMYILYDNIQNKQYYDESTLQTMPMQTRSGYLGSIIFVWVYDTGLIVWLWKSGKCFRNLNNHSMAGKLFSNCQRRDPTLERINTGLKDEPKEKKPIKRRENNNNNNNNDNNKEITETTKELVTDELGHAVDEEYNDETIIDEREQTDVVSPLATFPENMLNKRPTVTPAQQQLFKMTSDLDGMAMYFIKCKVIIYLFDLVITSCSAAILYRKTSAQIYKMDDKRFYKQFGGIDRVEMIQKHIEKMSKGAILYCITGKMNLKTLEAIIDRLGLLKYFKGTLSKELIDYLNQNSTIDRAISESQSPEYMQKSSSQSPGPPNSSNSNISTEAINVHIPSKLSKLSKLATLDEDDSLAVLDEIPNKNDKDVVIEVAMDKLNDDNDDGGATPNTPLNEEQKTSFGFGDIMGSIGDMKNMQKFRSDQSIRGGVDIKINILKFEGDDLTKEIRDIYEERLLAKNSDIMKETKGNAQINLLLFKFLQYYDVLNDEILVISPDLQTISYFKSIGLCKGYHISGGKGLNDGDVEEIQKYL